MEKSANSKVTKLSVFVAFCIVAMMGLILGIIFSTKISIFGNASDVYTLKNDYKLTQEDIDAIGLGDNGLGLTHACCINLNGHTLDLNGYDFSVISSESGKAITFKNGTVKGAGSLTVKGSDCDVCFDNVKLSCDYTIDTVNSKLSLVKTDADASRFTATGGTLLLNGSNISGTLDLKSNLEAYGSSLESVSATDVTAYVKGEVGCVLSAGIKAELKIYAAVNDVEAEQGSKVTVAKEQGGNEYKGGNIAVLNAKGGKVIVENCANVDELNVAADSVIDMSGTAAKLNVSSDSNITVNKCAIIDEVNVNSAATLSYAGTASSFNLNKNNSVDFKATAFIKKLLIAEEAAESEIAFNGQAGYISLGSDTVKFDAKRDSKIALISAVTDAYFAGDNFKTSSYSVIGEKAASAEEQKITEAMNSFIMPIFYINSDCKGDGFIKLSAGGNKADENPVLQYLAQIGHEYDYSVVKRSSESEHGIGRYTCRDCGEYYDKELPLRKIVLDTPTLFDLFGLNANDGTYTFGIDDEFFVLDREQFTKEATTSGETARYTVLVIEKAFIHATVENNRSDFNVKVFGNAEFKFAVYAVAKEDVEKISAAVSASKASAEKESVIDKLRTDYPEAIYMDIKAYMEGSEIYFTYDADKYTLGVYDILNMYLGQGASMATYYIGQLAGTEIELPENVITVDVLVNAINGLIKTDALLERYEPALTLLFNVIGNSAVFRNLLPAFDIVTEKDGVYSVNTDSLFEMLTVFGNQSVAEYIDSVAGRGTVSAVLDLVKEVYDLTIGEIYDYLVILASNLEKDEVDLIEDLDTVISIIIDNVNDMISETDKNNILSVLDKFFRQDNYEKIEAAAGSPAEEGVVYYTFDGTDYVVAEIDTFAEGVEYFVNNYTYSFANCMNNYENATVYQIIYGEDDGSTSYAENKASAQNAINELVESIEAPLYLCTIDNVFGMAAPIELIPYYEMISEFIYGEISWTLNAEDKLAQFSIAVDEKPVASSDAGEPSTEDLTLFRLSYDAENDKITEIFANIEAGPFTALITDSEDECYFDIAFAGIAGLEFSMGKNKASESKLDFSLDNFPTIIDMLEYVLDKSTDLYVGFDLDVYDLSLKLVKGQFTKVAKEAVFDSAEVYYTRNTEDGCYEIFEGDAFVAETDYFVIDSSVKMYSVLCTFFDDNIEVFLDLAQAAEDKLPISLWIDLAEITLNAENAYIKEAGKNIGQSISAAWVIGETTKWVSVLDGSVIYNNGPVISVGGVYDQYKNCEIASNKSIKEFVEENKTKLEYSDGAELKIDTDKVEGSFRLMDAANDKSIFTIDVNKHAVVVKEYRSNGIDTSMLVDVKYDADTKNFAFAYENGEDSYSGGVAITESENQTVYDVSLDAVTYDFVRGLLRSVSLPVPSVGENKTVDFQATKFFENNGEKKVCSGIAFKAYFSEELAVGLSVIDSEKDGFSFEVGKLAVKDGYVPVDGENIFSKYEIDPIGALEFSEGHAKLFVNYSPVKLTAVYNKGGFTGIDLEVLSYAVRFLVDTTNNLCDIYFDIPYIHKTGMVLTEETLTTTLNGTEHSYTITKTAENTFSLVNGSEKYILTFDASYNEEGDMTGLSIKAVTDDEGKALIYEGTFALAETENGCELTIALKARDTQVEGTFCFGYSDKDEDSAKLVGEGETFADRESWAEYFN